MKMDVFPDAVLFFPDAGFFEGGRRHATVGGKFLADSDVSDHGAVTDHSDQWRADDRLLRQAARLEVEIELVEGHALDHVSDAFGFERCQILIAQSRVGIPILLID